jgi:hypothetical protein
LFFSQLSKQKRNKKIQKGANTQTNKQTAERKSTVVGPVKALDPPSI